VILSGEFGGARVAYLGTDRDLGVIIESGTPDDRPQPDETPPLTPGPATNATRRWGDRRARVRRRGDT
jgi:hypothetical protein